MTPKSFALLLALFTCAGASAAELHCTADADCAKLGPRFQCLAQKTACAVHPESSTCVERLCRRKPGGPVKDEDRACKKDGDCAIVQLECQCMYCARPDDFQAGLVAAVNKKRVKAYESLSKCSTARCAAAGACAMTGTMEPRCRANTCFPEYQPRIEP